MNRSFWLTASIVTIIVSACTSPTPSSSTYTSISSATATATIPVEGPIFQLVWSLDSKLIAAVTQRGIHLYDRVTLALMHTLDVGEYTESATFSPDSAQLACICGEGLIKIWDVKDGQLLKTFKDDKYFTSVAYSPNGNQIAGGNSDGTVKVRNANGASLLFTLAGL